MNDSLPQDSATLPNEAATGLTAVTVGLGWNGADTPAPDWDLDLSALLCDESGKVLSDRHFYASGLFGIAKDFGINL